MSGKKKGARSRTHVHVHYYENLNKPAHPAETPAAVRSLPADEEMCAVPDVDKATGNPVGRPDGQSWTAARVSPSRVAGNQALSVGDHGASLPPGGSRELAYQHPALRQSRETPAPWVTMRERMFDEHGDRSITRGPVGTVALSMLDQAGAAGTFTGMNSMTSNPAARPAPGIARPNAVGEGTGRNTLSQPESRAPMSMKASDRREVMRRHMFPGSGGAR